MPAIAKQSMGGLSVSEKNDREERKKAGNTLGIPFSALDSL